MNKPSDHESNQPIIPLQPEQATDGELHSQHPVTRSLGEYTVGTATADAENAASVALAELPSADDIPSLLPELAWITSANEHRYDESNTVYTKSSLAKKTPEGKRTYEQQSLLDDMDTIQAFAPYSSSYEDVYTPKELHGLTTELRSLSSKNRPDFNGVEGKVLDVVIGAMRTTDLVPSSVREIAKRAEKSQDTRKGMQWDTLVKLASEASKIIRCKATKSSSEYFVDVADPAPKVTPDLSKVYQFVADAQALEVLGKRTSATQESRRDAFVSNCEVVNEWYAQVAPILANLPHDFKVGRFSAAWEVASMIETMNARLVGDEKTGRKKDYRSDPAGAISLQKRIGHTVEAIKQKLSGEDIDETEIVPLED